MQDQKGSKNIRAEEEQITAARAKQHEDEEEDTGIRPKKTKTTERCGHETSTTSRYSAKSE